MNELPHISTHARTTMLIADQEARAAATWADREADLSRRYTEVHEAANRRRAEIQAELEAIRAKADAELHELSEGERRAANELADAARRKDHHAAEAEDARQTILAWCDRHGVNVADLPVPSETSGPLPVLSPEVMALGQQMARPENGSPDVTRTDFPVQPKPPTGTVDQRAELPGGDEAPASFQGGEQDA